MTMVVSARGLSKSFGSLRAVDNISFDIPLGRIVGVIGANGAGKTTLLNAILGLTRYDGELKVLGRDPGRDRAALMREVSFISDVATLPRWSKVSQLLDYVALVHPGFSRAKTESYLRNTKIRSGSRIQALSKGMVTQLHLALVMGIEARLLVLDEPTLGLDIIFRKTFYRNLLEDFFSEDRTIIITTHQVEEIEQILSDAMFIDEGHVALFESIDALGEKYAGLSVAPERLAAARALGPISEQSVMGRALLVYEDVPRERLRELGEVGRVSLSDLFVAKMTGSIGA